jgi:uncharacterized protein YcbK (DUF882 family)
MSIKLVEAAEFFKGLPHQIDAFNWLQDQVDPLVLESFASKYRTEKEKESFQEYVYVNTWDGVLAAAKDAGSKYPEVVAAQWALESGWGAATSGKNNYFGLKGNGSNVNTQEFINGKWVTIKAGFIDFPDLHTCVCYLVDRWYKDFGTYKGVNRAKDRNDCAKLLVAEGYATDPSYSTKLIQIMDRKIGAVSKEENKTTFNPSSTYSTHVTEHITYGELTLNQEARRFTKQYQCDTAKELCVFLEKARAHFGNKPLIITSGSRPEPINSSVGGARNSEHTYDAPSKGAIDFYIDGISVWTLQDWCDKNWPNSVGYGAKKGFVHLGMRPRKPKVRWDY